MPTIKLPEIKTKNLQQEEELILYDEHRSEQIVWVGRPSEIKYIFVYILCGLTSWAIIPLIVIFFIHYINQSKKYILTNERLRICSGILVRRIVDLELYRVKNTAIVEPLHFRLFKLGTIELHTSDQSNPLVLIEGVTNFSKIEDMIRHYVEKRRDEKKVQEIDQYQYLGQQRG